MKTNTMKVIYPAVLMLFFAGSMFSQTGGVGINNDGSSPNAKAMLDVSSTNKGFLPPRMTSAQRNSISSPAAGLIIWCTNCASSVELNVYSGELQIYNGFFWTNLLGGTPLGLPGAPTIGAATVGYLEALVTFTQPASDGGSPILSYTAKSSPGNFTGTLNQAGSGTVTVTGLTNGTAYTFTITATNENGTGLSSAVSNSVTPGIGGSYGGGKVFYLDISGEHGLIAATSDQGGIRWALYDYESITVPLGTSTVFGAGSANTDHIISQHGAGATGYAAALARAYTGGGYNDWYLPSKDELNILYLNRAAIGGFTNDNYWSSSEPYGAPPNNVWSQNFGDGLRGCSLKYQPNRVRAIRAF
ncbi:MAG: DUF1566 domain-containing protein [Bacteroidetes bacterium]|nr:DUF1566 domain-containing protein [Bacteroidota bacterium]